MKLSGAKARWIVAFVVAVIATPALPKDDFGAVDGAIWRFTMSRTFKGGSETRRGGFRISGADLLQPIEPVKDDETDLRKVESEVIGQKLPKPRKGKTVLKFGKLRTFLGKKPQPPIKGEAFLSFDEFGKWHGRFIDGDGHYWELKAERWRE